MKPIPTKTHGVIDYVVGIVLIVAPFLFGFADVPAARNSAWIVGIGSLIYSLLTNYELGLIKALPVRLHLGLDIIAGIFLAASPWLLDYADEIFWPHLLVGLAEVGIACMTRTAPESFSSLPHGTPGAHAHSHR